MNENSILFTKLMSVFLIIMSIITIILGVILLLEMYMEQLTPTQFGILYFGSASIIAIGLFLLFISINCWKEAVRRNQTIKTYLKGGK
jgi:hypothetical protein